MWLLLQLQLQRLLLAALNAVQSTVAAAAADTGQPKSVPAGTCCLPVLLPLLLLVQADHRIVVNLC